MNDEIKTLTQTRAEFALEKVKEVNNKEYKDKYKTYALKVSSLIVSNGLIPTLAFLKAKGDRKEVYNTLNEWLKKKKFINQDALEELVNSDVSRLRLATMEILEFANWLKRMAEVELGEKE
ncbi:MAG: type III-B CRISPR module-associated protein Cmr5 [Candidatus Ratteibacteria bacterium]